MPRKRKPSADSILEQAKLLVEQNRQRNSLFDQMDRIYDQERTESAPESDDSVVLVRMPHGTNAVDLITDLLAQSKMVITVPAASESAPAKREADLEEKWLRAWLQKNERIQGQNLVAGGAWYAAMRSVVCLKTVFSKKLIEDHQVANVPVVLQLRDPRHTYWRYGVTGLECVVECYNRLAGEIMAHYPGVLDPKEYDEDSEVEWVEYWDDTYRAYFCEGNPIAVEGKQVVPHGYGIVPYAFGWARSTPRTEPGKRYRPLLAGVADTLRALDIYASIRATAAHDVLVNAWAVFSDQYGHGSRELDTGPDAINYFGAQDKIQAMQRGPLPEDLASHGGELMSAFQQGTFPMALYGQISGQMAGYAINMLLASGRRPMIPIYAAVQDAFANAFRNCVLICREKVAPLVGEKICLTVKAKGEDGTSYKRELMLDTNKIGDDWDCEVTMSDPMPADEASNLRMAIEATKAGLLSAETALTKYKVVPDALDEMTRIQIEAIFRQLAGPEMKRLAIERGYLPPAAMETEKVPTGAPQQVPMPVIPERMVQPEMPPVMEPNVALMQNMAGQGPFMPEMGEMSGEAPAGEAAY